MMENVNNFLTEIIDEDIANGLSERIHTRFPPEPNGYLHIGSAKAIFINWSIAKKYNGLFNLRYDDTNPVKEDTEYVDSIWEDIKWLTGEEPSGGVFYGSDYFETCFECAVQLIKDGKAYVDDLTQEEMREYRGSLTEPGKESPYRDRSVEENLQLFQDMRDGKFADGSKTLRAKIDMASPNMNLRDPAIYRIVRAHHHRQGERRRVVRIPCARLVEISLDVGDERVAVALFVRVHDHARRLVREQDVLVLVDHGQARRFDAAERLLLAHLFKVFVVDVELHPVALGEAAGSLGAFAVELDALEAQVLVHHAARQPRHGFL